MRKTKVVLLSFLFSLLCLGSEPGVTRKVVCWGDSLTAPHPGCYPDSLSRLLGPGYEVVNRGVGGENTLTIMARQGARPMVLAHDVTVFKSAEVRFDKWLGDSDVPAFLSSGDQSVVRPLIQHGWEEDGPSGVNPCRIGGRLFQIRSEAHFWYEKSFMFEYNYFLCPADTLSETLVLRKGTPVETAAMREPRPAYANIFFMGQNGGFEDPDDLVRQYKEMIAYSGCDRYVIIGFHSPNYCVPDIREMKRMERTMKKAFGAHYINNREYLVRYGLKEAGLEPTPEDEAAMKEGRVPPQLTTDGVHFTPAAYGILAGEIARRFARLNYTE
ncbi:MAG: hypothetical protein IJ654_04065 [Bacteroidales bacterium]|nr:hypothetical protein [Bacteroidales bacterium]